MPEKTPDFHTVAKLIPDPVLVFVEKRLHYANPAAVKLLGVSVPEDLIARPLSSIVKTDNAVYLLEQAVHTDTLDQHPGAPIRQRWTRLDGTPIDIEGYVGPIRWEDKTALLIVGKDVCGQIKTEHDLRDSETRYRHLINSIDVGYCTIEVKFDEHQNPVDYRFIEVNPAFERHTGLTDAAGKWIRELNPQLEQHWFDTYGKVALTGHPIRFENSAATMGGRTFDVFAFQVGEPGQNRVGILFTDVTAKKALEEELRISNERLQLAVHGSGDVIWDWDLTSNKMIVSPRIWEILGHEPTYEFSNAQQWHEMMYSEDSKRMQTILEQCRQGKTDAYHSEYRLRCKNGEWKWFLCRGIVVARTPEGIASRMTGLLSDISERKRTEELVWRQANFDALTGLPNRRMFRDRLDWETRKANRHHSRLAVMFIDLDRFKEVNDLHGHDTGDMLLRQAAERIQRCVRHSDTVSRLGGDEFTVILNDLDSPDHAERVAQKILGVLAQPFLLHSDVVHISGSIGIAIYPEDGNSSQELIRKADQAMYSAKRAGKAQFSYFTRVMDEKAHKRLIIINELRHALAKGELQVHYQPIVDMQSEKIVKAEALLRWTHPQLGQVQPSVFIPLAEESGLINEIGDWVFSEAAECSRRWSELLGKTFQVGINKSPLQFMSRNQQDWTQQRISKYLQPGSLSIELTESVLLHASVEITHTLSRYRQSGFQLAIDDFGTGYSSLSYLKKFSIDYVKIDRSFIEDMESDAGNRIIAESIIAMAHKLGLQVIAEGIETTGQRDLLRAAGCDLAQGFLYSHPVPSPDFERMLH